MTHVFEWQTERSKTAHAGRAFCFAKKKRAKERKKERKKKAELDCVILPKSNQHARVPSFGYSAEKPQVV